MYIQPSRLPDWKEIFGWSDPPHRGSPLFLFLPFFLGIFSLLWISNLKKSPHFLGIFAFFFWVFSNLAGEWYDLVFGSRPRVLRYGFRVHLLKKSPPTSTNSKKGDEFRSFWVQLLVQDFQVFLIHILFWISLFCHNYVYFWNKKKNLSKMNFWWRKRRNYRFRM